jgi:hypothetical protein
VVETTVKFGKVEPNRMLLNAGSAAEVLAAHRRHVDKLIAAGAFPKTPPMTPAAVIEQLRERYREGRELRKKSPFSWADAVHAAFKVCRREYLADSCVASPRDDRMGHAPQTPLT